MRRMSFAATTKQMYYQAKTVTRRNPDTWTWLEPGDLVMAVEKTMGLTKGERQKCIHPIEILDVSVVQLLPLTPAEVAAEGFPDMTEAEFLAQVWGPLHGPVTGSETVRRIEFRHRLDLWTPGYLMSNGTEGEMFRADWCYQCAHDHAVHFDPDNAGYPDKPGVCRILTESLTAYPGPGPDEWESRVVDGQLDKRCTAFQQCVCDIPSAIPGGVPVEIEDRWRPKQHKTLEGQQTLLG